MKSALTTLRAHIRMWFSSFLSATLLFGCKTAHSHPPTFADFQRAFFQGSLNPPSTEAQVAVFAAAQLSASEMQRILAGNQIERLIGAGTQARVDDPEARKLLARATVLSPTNPVAWAALAYRDLSLLRNKAADSQVIAKELTNAIATWRSLAATNSAPLYLEAAFQCLRTNFVTARNLVVEASRKEGFDSYDIALKKCVVLALESVGSSKYTARIVASGNCSGVVEWSTLAKIILGEYPEDTEAVRSCLLFGSRLSQGRSFLEELVGDSIQIRAMDKLGGKSFSAEKSRIAERKTRIKQAVHYLDSARTRKISEKKWVEYYDTCFDTNEMSAIESLAAYSGDTF